MSSLQYATQDDILAWMKKIAANYRLLAPKQQGASIVFKPYTADELQDLQPLLCRATISPKEAVLPRSETLVRFSAKKDSENPAKLDMSLDSACQAEPTVLFGGRPCDAKGFVVLDRPYLEGKFQDPYYKARREATLIITQTCPGALATCFCNWLGGSPTEATGSDILFTTIDGGFALQAVTEKGQALLAGAGFKPADEKGGALEAAWKNAAASLPAQFAEANIPGKIASRFSDEAFWSKETAKCLSCGACTYICPTCQCFGITDEGSALEGKRLRSWDSCMNPLFTLEASGHNPRADKARRMRNRVSHKFSYYPQTYAGAYSCVGCGRCVISCPVSLDIRHMMTAAVLGAGPNVPPPVGPGAPAAPKTAAHKTSGKKVKE